MEALTLEYLGDGNYLKVSGAPLEPGQKLMFSDELVTLPDTYKEEEYKGRTIRAWAVESINGGFYGISEILSIGGN